MKQYKLYLFIVLLSSILFTSCEDVDVDDFNAGEADFTTYVALGNSITAGYLDGTLYLDGQQNSFPSILAQSMQSTGGAQNFTQPLVDDNAGGLLFNGQPLEDFPVKLVFNGTAPVRTTDAATTDIANNISAQGPFQNLGVPGAKSFHLLGDEYGNPAGLLTSPATANPYYVRFSQQGESLISAAASQNPTFFTLWIGNNDALTYAAAGGAEDALTPQPTFAGSIQTILSTLTANDAEGVISNIPNITDLPYFTVVPTTPLVPVDEDGTTEFGQQVPALNQVYAQLNQVFDILQVPERKIVFSETDPNPVVIHDESLVDLSVNIAAILSQTELAPFAEVLGQQFGQSRFIDSDELLTLPSSSVIGELNMERLNQLTSAGVPAQFAGQLSVNGVTLPLENNYVLTQTEIDEISSAIDSYNQTIADAATQFGIALADMNAYFSQVSNTGVFFNGATYTVDFVTGGLFSLDGIHPTQKGYAIIANEFVDVINDFYNADLPFVDINNYPGVEFP